jgi:hypothetical protein
MVEDMGFDSFLTDLSMLTELDLLVTILEGIENTRWLIEDIMENGETEELQRRASVVRAENAKRALEIQLFLDSKYPGWDSTEVQPDG